MLSHIEKSIGEGKVKGRGLSRCSLSSPCRTSAGRWGGSCCCTSWSLWRRNGRSGLGGWWLSRNGFLDSSWLLISVFPLFWPIDPIGCVHRWVLIFTLEPGLGRKLPTRAEAASYCLDTPARSSLASVCCLSKSHSWFLPIGPVTKIWLLFKFDVFLASGAKHREADKGSCSSYSEPETKTQEINKDHGSKKINADNAESTDRKGISTMQIIHQRRQCVFYNSMFLAVSHFLRCWGTRQWIFTTTTKTFHSCTKDCC